MVNKHFKLAGKQREGASPRTGVDTLKVMSSPREPLRIRELTDQSFAHANAEEEFPEDAPIVLEHCPECGYSRIGVSDCGKCPECGWHAQAGEVVLWGKWVRANPKDRFEELTNRRSQNFLETTEYLPTAIILLGYIVLMSVLSRMLIPRRSVKEIVITFMFALVLGVVYEPLRRGIANLRNANPDLMDLVQFRYTATHWSVRLGSGKPRWRKWKRMSIRWDGHEDRWRVSLSRTPRVRNLVIYKWDRLYTFRSERRAAIIVALNRLTAIHKS